MGQPLEAHRHVALFAASALPLSLTRQDSIQPRLHLAFLGGNDSAQTEGATPETRSSTLGLQIERIGSLKWTARGDLGYEA